MSVYSKGQSIGSLFNSPLIVEVPLTPANSKVVTQVITAKDGKPGYIFRGKAVMLAAKPAATKVAGFVDADVEQFLASDAETGFTEPAGLTFSDLELSYVEDGNGTRVWQKKADITASALTNAIAESGVTTAARSTSGLTAITDFITKNLVVILIVLAVLLFIWMQSGNKKGRKSKGFSFGF